VRFFVAPAGQQPEVLHGRAHHAVVEVHQVERLNSRDSS
jgi:hypothetical protein